MKKHLTRRRLLASGAGAGVGLLLRGLATGLPPAFLAAPRRALAQGEVAPQTLILATSSRGDPVNVNCPGSYVDGVTNNPLLDAGNVRLGEARVRGAQPWRELPLALRNRLAFFHYRTHSAAHPEYASTMTFHGSVKNAAGNGAEMFPSMIADLSASGLGTLQREPLPLCDEVLTFEAQPLQNLRPSEVKALFAPQEDRLADLRAVRDQTLDALYGQLRDEGRTKERAFVDRYVQSRDQSRALGEQLGDLLARLPIDPDVVDGPADQVIAAVALARLRIAPVVTINIPFGGDNHQDADLTIEAAETTSGVATIGQLWAELNDAGLQDEVSFAMLNVFGRSMNRNATGGRNHNRQHAVMVAFGQAVQPGVYGGMSPTGEALNIDARTGAGQDGADISADESMQSAGKSLARALGHDAETVDTRIQGGRLVDAFLAG